MILAVVMMQDDRQWYPLPNGVKSINPMDGDARDYYAPVTVTEKAVVLGLQNVTLLCVITILDGQPLLCGVSEATIHVYSWN